MKSATYWVQGFGRLVVLAETEPGTDLAALNADPGVAKASLAFAELARNTDTQSWMDPRAGAAALNAGAGD